MPIDRELLHDDLTAMLAARRELSTDEEEYLVESFLDRVEQQVSPGRWVVDTLQRHQYLLRLASLQRFSGFMFVFLVAVGVLSLTIGVPYSLDSTALRPLYDEHHTYQISVLVAFLAFCLTSFLHWRRSPARAARRRRRAHRHRDPADGVRSE